MIITLYRKLSVYYFNRETGRYSFVLLFKLFTNVENSHMFDEGKKEVLFIMKKVQIDFCGMVREGRAAGGLEV